MRRRFARHRRGQVALADAVLTLIILLVASTILFTGIAGVVSTSSGARQRAELKETALEVGGMPLEASYPDVSFTNRSSGEVHHLQNATGERILTTYLSLRSHSQRTGDQYDCSGLLDALRDLYDLALPGRAYAVHAYGTLEGEYIDLLISSGDQAGAQDLASVSEVPHPRVVTRKDLYHAQGDIVVDLYLWK